jgi:hypothetical protein
MADNRKIDFIDSLDELSGALNECLGMHIPVVEDFAYPDTVDESIVAQGRLAWNINLILKEFQGLPVVRLLLHIGQYNTVLRSALLAGLEFTGMGKHTFTIAQPMQDTFSKGESFVNIPLSVIITEGEAKSASVNIDCESENIHIPITLEKDGDTWSSDVSMGVIGVYTLLFSVHFTDNDYIASQTMEIEIVA